MNVAEAAARVNPALDKIVAKIDWLDPLYSEVYELRTEMLRRMRADPGLVPGLRDFYREHPAQFIEDWGVTFDPRNADLDKPTIVPFILTPKQREWVAWVLERWQTRSRGINEKSRDMGVTWLAVALSSSLCLFRDGVVVGFGSRKAEYVDEIGTMKPILPKVRMFVEHVPREFRGDWEAWRDAPKMRISFPMTGSLITGEAGDNIGRGDRTSIFFVDEAQPLDAKILTPKGWALMADMAWGREIIGADGKRHIITHVNDCGVHNVYRVGFSDGSSTECSENHLWDVTAVIGKKRCATMRLRELATNWRYESPGGHIQYRYRVPVCDPVRFARRRNGRLPLDPYLLGALLGDGSMRSGCIRITSADAEIIDAFRRLLPPGIIVGAFDGKYSHNIVDALGRRGRRVGGEYIRSAARTAVLAAGIANLVGPEKFVPEKYKFASPDDRLSLLQGLMDTDGSASNGSASFHTTSSRLADDVRFLVQSLGGTAWHNVKPDHRGYRNIHALQIALPNGVKPFRLRRKLTALLPRKHPPGRTITSIEYVGRRPVRCITVDADDGLYLTNDFIVTHNSAHLERPQLVERALSQTTNCRIDMSSVNGMNNPFAQRRWSGTVPVFSFNWRDDPRKNEEWYRKQQKEFDPVTVAQEIDMDYSASVEGIVIPGAWVRAAVDFRQWAGIAPSGLRAAALDVADEGVDKNAAALVEGIQVDGTEEWSGKGSDIYSSVERMFALCDENGYDEFRYDADGLGAGVRGDARVINERRASRNERLVRAVGFRGSEGVWRPEAVVEGTMGREGDKGRKNKDFFLNRKSQGRWALRGRFQKTYRWRVENVRCDPNNAISISSRCPHYMELVAQLSQPTYQINGVGKIVIDKKPDGMPSPNRADAVMIRYAPMEAPPHRVDHGTLAKIASVDQYGRPRGRLGAPATRFPPPGLGGRPRF